MRLTAKKWTSVGAAALLVGLGLAACGSEDAGGSGDTSSVGEEAGTELSQENFFEEITSAQLDAETAHMSMDMGESAGGMNAKGQIRVDDDPAETAVAMTMEGADASMPSMDMRLVEGVLYMNMGQMTDDKFVELDLNDENNPLGEQFGSMTDTMDPAKQLAILEEAITGFEQKGDAEEIDGVEATPYDITVDTQAVLEEMGGSEMPQGAEVPEELTYTMFIGPDNLPRRILMEIPGAGGSVAIDYSKWGEDVSIEAPAEDEITTDSPFSTQS